MTELSVVGKSVIRLDAREKVLGKAIYCSDINLPGMLHVKALRSPFPHARIISIDASAAQKLRGVRCVVTGGDAPEKRFGVGMVMDQTVLARDVARYAGEPVAAVAADTAELAEEAIGLIKVEYLELPAMFDPEVAMGVNPSVVVHPDFPSYRKAVSQHRLDPDRPNVFTHGMIRKGDVAAGFAEADLILENRFSTAKVQHCPLETHAVVIRPEPDGGLTFFTGRQGVWPLKGIVAETFGINASRVRIIQHYVGGGFGGKINCLELLPALLALKTGRPVRWALTREEEFVDGGHKQASIIYIKDGVRKDGTIVAREMRAVVNAGAYESVAAIIASANGHAAGGDYRIPNLKWDSYGVYTNDPPGGAFRGFGIPEVIWAIESHMDMLAERINISPAEIRKRNLLREGEPNAMGEITHSTGAAECLDRVVHFLGKQAKAPMDGPWKTGRGISISNKYSTAPTVSGATVRITEDKIIVLHSADEVGQGCNTVLAQVAAEEFGVSTDEITVVCPDTFSTPYFAEGTNSSRVTYNLGNAVRMACEDAKRDLFQRAGEKLEVSSADLETKGKVIYVKGSPEKKLRFSELFIPFRGRDPGVHGGAAPGGEIAGKATFVQDYTPDDPRTGQLDPTQAAQGKRLRAFCVHGAKAAEVAVNVETGEIRVLRCYSATDIGKAINPKMCEQQSEGGMSQGIGTTLYEEMVMEKGVVVNSNFTDYRLPGAGQMPYVENMESVFVESAPHKDGPYGAKGFGEASMLGVEPAIGNAIYDAVGVRVRDLPISHENMLRSLRERGRS